MPAVPTDLTLRPVGEGELDALLALYAHLHAVDEPPLSGDAAAAAWRELSGSPRHQCVGGYVDHVLVASCVATVIPNLTRGCRPYAVIENVVTHAQHRGRGYGKAVLRSALQWCWAQGCYKAMLMTGRKDAATLQFYAFAGFDGVAKRAFLARP